MQSNSILLLKRLWTEFDRKSKNNFSKVLLLTLASSLAEMLTIGAAVPFLAVLTSPETALSYLQKFESFKELTSDFSEFYKLWFVAAFGIAAVVAGIIRVWLLRSSTNLAYVVGAEISSKMFSSALSRNYEDQCTVSSSSLIDLISVKSFNIVIVVQTALSLFSNLFIFATIVVAVVLVAPLYVLYGSSAFVLAYLLIIKFTKNKISTNAVMVSQGSLKAVSIVSEGFGAIRDIIIDGNIDYYIELFRKNEFNLRLSQAANSILGNSPRYLMESLGLLTVAILGYQMTSSTALSGMAIPILGALALAAQRLLPVLQQIYWGWSSIQTLLPSLEQQLELIEQNQNMQVSAVKEGNIPQLELLEFKNVKFAYKGSDQVLKCINIIIKKGEKIGIVGETGSGKSTFVDLLMGLLRPTDGEILINGIALWKDIDIRAWQSNLAHVPQTIYLANGTVATNISFGSAKKETDLNKLNESLSKAKVDWSLYGGSNILEQKVGENGSKLSGGQRQRIGIARALYKSAKLIVFDEATSALDQKTENEIMNTIYDIDNDITLLIIAHRYTTLSRCDKIIEIKDGFAKVYQSYSEYMGAV